MTYAFHPERDGDLHARALTLANLLYGLRGALNVLREEKLDNVFRCHDRRAEPTCRVVHACSLEIRRLNPAEYSSSLTGVLMPDSRNEGEFCKVVLDNFNMSLRSGLGKVARI
jgi:alanine-glyoxylate transaminase/serine-glyoxylate transaminase/serine-pyruvate transaminase